MQTYGSRFQMMMAARSGGHKVILYQKDGSDAGLYLKRFVNDFKTPLAARGTVEELEAFHKELL